VDDPRTITNTGACKFNLSKTKTSIEQAIYNSKSVPGPGKYGICDDPRSLQSAGACKFNLSITKDTIDLAIHAKRDVPGPGKYKIGKVDNRNNGVKFSDANTKSNLEQCILNANNTPGPNQYVVPTSMATGGGKVSDAHTPDFITMAVNRSKEIPGQKYNPGKTHDFLESGGGGKFSASKTLNFISQAISDKKHVPGPGKYQPSIRTVNNPDADWTVNGDKISVFEGLYC
jgi:hypothetical protein